MKYSIDKGQQPRSFTWYFALKEANPVRNPSNFPNVLTPNPRFAPSTLISTTFLQLVAHVGASGCSTTSGSLVRCHSNRGAYTSALGSQIDRTCYSDYKFPEETEQFCDRRKTTSSCSPVPVPAPSPTSHTALPQLIPLMSFIKQQKTFIAMLNITRKMRNILTLKQHHLGVYHAIKSTVPILRMLTKRGACSNCPPSPLHTNRYLYEYVILLYTSRVLSINIFPKIPTLW